MLSGGQNKDNEEYCISWGMTRAHAPGLQGKESCGEGGSMVLAVGLGARTFLTVGGWKYGSCTAFIGRCR